MCGIAGIVGFKDKKALLAMLEATKHRGPDNTGTYYDQDVALGMNRLSIVDLSNKANQPMFSEDGRYIIVYNGEVYNYKDLKSDLEKKGYSFTSHSDTEVVLNAYVCYGKKMLELIQGMFAFVIWDKHEKKLFAARDHLGIKPLLYYHSGNTFVFCSELKGMLSSGYFKSHILNEKSIMTFFALGHAIAPDTFITGISSLKSAHYLEYQDNNLSVEQYWHPDEITPIKSGELHYRECINHIRELVKKSVNEQLMSDVPLGIFLSGGLDSNIVATALRVNGIKHFATYTIGFKKKNTQLDEADLSERFASFYQSKHTTVRIEESEVADYFQDFITAIDQPSRDGLNTYLISRYVSRNVKVALSGLGGDELFLGYLGFFSFLNNLNPDQHNVFNYIVLNPIVQSLIPSRALGKLKRPTARYEETLNYVMNLQPNVETIGRKALNYDWNIYDAQKYTADLINREYKRGTGEVNRIRMLYVNQFMGNLLLRDSDAVAMSSSLEVRFPLISKDIIEFAYRMPAEYLILDLSIAKQRNYEKSGLKRMLRDAFVNELPPFGFNQSKRGFQLPVADWLRTSLKGHLEDTIFNPSEIFDKRNLARLYRNGNYQSINFKLLFSIMILDQWYKQVFIGYNSA